MALHKVFPYKFPRAQVSLHYWVRAIPPASLNVQNTPSAIPKEDGRHTKQGEEDALHTSPFSLETKTQLCPDFGISTTASDLSSQCG